MQKLDRLTYHIKQNESCSVAFSGGVDSSFLLSIVHSILKDKCTAITIDTPYIPGWEIAEAKEFCIKHSINHKIIPFSIPESIKNNPKNHCYLCKYQIFEAIILYSKENGISCIYDGSNADDLNDYRPGLKALKELKIQSPLLELGFTKNDIRRYSKELNLPVWDKPAYACLLSRLPIGTEITIEELERIEKAELFLMGKGFKGARLRSHGEIARIELRPDDRIKLVHEPLLAEVSNVIKSLGYKHVCMELEGYTSGSMN